MRLPERPIADASEQLVNRHLVAAALGRQTQERAYYALRALRLAIEELEVSSDGRHVRPPRRRLPA